MQLDPASNIKEVEAAINEFQRKLDRLKVLYEQYFMGIEKREPLIPLKDVIRIMRELDNVQLRNTGLKFRFRGLVQKLNSYKTYWNRTLRAIENGTYHRDLARVRRNLARKGIVIPKAGKLKSVADVERALSDAAKQEKEKVSNDTDKVPAITDDFSPANIRGVPADHLRQQFTPQPGLGPIDLSEDDDEQTEQSSRNPADLRQPYPATAPSAQPPMPGQHAPAPPSRPDLPRSPSQQLQRPPSQPDLPRSPSQQLQRPPSQPDLPRSPSQQLQRPPSRPDLPGVPRPQPRAAQRRAAQPPPRPAAQPGDRSALTGMSEQKIQSIYRRFVKAKKLCGEDTSSVRYESIANSINKQLPKIRKQYGDREVDFQVVIRSGRAVLKAKVK